MVDPAMQQSKDLGDLKLLGIFHYVWSGFLGCGTLGMIGYFVALGGIFAAIAGIALTGLIHSADSTLGLQYTLTAIAAVSLGGTPVGGGRGGLVGAFLGAICIYLIQNLLGNLNVSAQWLDVVYGVVLIIAVILSAQLRPRRRAEVPV